jgi:hypothetical protein
MIEYAVSIKFMIIGYSIALIILGIYLVSLYLRWKRLQQDIKTLGSLEK